MITGEPALLRALLDDAISSLLDKGITNRKQKLQQEAQAWIWDDTTDWPFCITNVCSWLQIDLNYLRKGLLVALERQQPWNFRPNCNRKDRQQMTEEVSKGHRMSRWHLGRAA